MPNEISTQLDMPLIAGMGSRVRPWSQATFPSLRSRARILVMKRQLLHLVRARQLGAGRSAGMSVLTCATSCIHYMLKFKVVQGGSQVKVVGPPICNLQQLLKLTYYRTSTIFIASGICQTDISIMLSTTADCRTAAIARGQG